MIKNRSGFTLVELLAIMAVLSLVMLISTVTLVDAMRLEQSAAQTVSQGQARANLAELFRGDVRQAVDAPTSWSKLEAGPACLILKHRDGRHIVYHVVDGQLERVNADAAKESRQILPLGRDVKDVSFSWTNKPRLATVQIRYQTAPERPVRLHEITASFGGELR